jgi:hypothetical protein
MDQPLIKDLRKCLSYIINLECWYVNAGYGVGSSFSISLGKKVPRKIPIKNPKQSEEYQRYEGEADLLIWCSWRLDSKIAPVASSDENSTVIASSLKILIEKKILAVKVYEPAWDLYIKYSNDLKLHVLCDHIPGNPSFNGNWDIKVGDTIISVGPGYRLEKEICEK